MSASLSEVFQKYDTDKGPFFHNYCRQYDPLFQRFRDKPVRMLEIGVWYGNSLKAWREAFPKAEVIVGVDIESRCSVYSDPERGIIVEIADATKKEVLEDLSKRYGPFDIILDDGSHVNTDVIRTFESAFPLLKEDGLYVVEDTHVWKVDRYVTSGAPNHLIYFAQILPFLNQMRQIDSVLGPKDTSADPFKIQKKTDNFAEQSIDKIEFGCGYIALTKKTRFHWIPVPDTK
jgi:hypothetical protein